MPHLITYTVMTLGDVKLHQLHTRAGKYFIMGEVARVLFGDSPTAFLQELRRGKYTRTDSTEPGVLQTIASLGLEVESGPPGGAVVLLPPATLELLLVDRRRSELVVVFKLASLKLASQESARLMASGDYDAALPVAYEALALGERIFKPAPALQLFPLYLLVAQANLGLRRGAQCEKALSLAGMLALKESNATSNIMRSQLSRLHGQLYAFQGRASEALQAFAEDTFYCSIEYGPQEERTSLGYYNLGKVLAATGDAQGAAACGDMVVAIWRASLTRVVLRVDEDGNALSPDVQVVLPVGRLQQLEVVEMLLDVAKTRRQEPDKSAVLRSAEAELVAALQLLELSDVLHAMKLLQGARSAVQQVQQQQQQQPEQQQQQQQQIEQDMQKPSPQVAVQSQCSPMASSPVLHPKHAHCAAVLLRLADLAMSRLQQEARER